MASLPYSGLSVRKRRPPDVHGRHAARHSRFSPMRIPSRTRRDGRRRRSPRAVATCDHPIRRALSEAAMAGQPRPAPQPPARNTAAQRRPTLRRHAVVLAITIAPWPSLALRSDGSAGDPAHDRADCGPAPAAQYPANHPPVTPPRMAPPTGSCAAAFCIGAAMASESKAAAPNARYIVIRRAELEGTAIMERIMPIRSLLSECSFNTDQTEMIDHLGSNS